MAWRAASSRFFIPMEVCVMNSIQKQDAQVMRSQGASTTDIAKALGLSVNTVKSYLRRCRLSSTSEETGSKEYKDRCKQCGKLMERNHRGHPRKFCSDDCCTQYWNERMLADSRKSLAAKPCACCGRLFLSYPTQGRRYCSHRCYIAARYHKGVAQ